MTYKELKFPTGSIFLVTGGAGFIGSNLCEAILNLGYNVRCLDDLSTGKQANVDLFIDNPNYEFIKGDIKDLDTCMKVCEGVDYVLNQAAWRSVSGWRPARPSLTSRIHAGRTSECAEDESDESDSLAE